MRIEKQRTEVRLEKFYNTIAHAIAVSTAKFGDPKNWDYSSARIVYENYFEGVIAGKVTNYYDFGRGPGYSAVYVRMNDGTCAVLSYNYSYGPYIRNYDWKVNLTCGRAPQEQGVTIFDLNLYNFINPKIRCNYEPSGCGWLGDKSYDPAYAVRYDKATCDINSNYAWKAYGCFLKMVQDGFKFKDDYKFYAQSRKTGANSTLIKYWK